MTMGIRPYYALDIDGTTIDTGPLVALRLRREANGGIDALDVALDRRTTVVATPEAAVSLTLGYDGDGETVFTGTVTETRDTLTEHRLQALGAQWMLARLRPSETFLAQSAADVVRALADAAGVAVARADAGERLARYHADGALDGFEHAKRLARLAGVDLLATRDGELVFSAPRPAASAVRLVHGINLIDACAREVPPAQTAFEVIPESAASSDGVDAETWIVKKARDLAGSAGEGPSRRISTALCTTRDAAGALAEALAAEAASHARRLDALVPGLPEIELGDTVEVESMPEGRGDGTWLVWRIEHRLDTVAGFRTHLTMRTAP
ncbi:MAG: hypothetical protein H6983_23880 [Ectothiorhodospiraceae bacterium]|nr:hypothetical protein [Ectothiorhodospiraceae bacterium]